MEIEDYITKRKILKEKQTETNREINELDKVAEETFGLKGDGASIEGFIKFFEYMKKRSD